MTELKETGVFVVSSEYKKNNRVEYSYLEAYSWDIYKALQYAHQEIKKCAERYFHLHKLTPIVEFLDGRSVANGDGIGYRLRYDKGIEGTGGIESARDTVIVTYTVNSLPPVSEYLS